MILKEFLRKCFPDINSYLSFLLALFIATIYWGIVVTEQKEIKTIETQVRFTNIPLGFTITGLDSKTKISVEISATNEVLKKITPDDVKIEVDASKFSPGTIIYELSAKDVVLPSSVSLINIFPKVLQLQLEKIIKGSFPLKPNFVGKPKNNKGVIYYKIEPPTVEILGAESVIKNLRYIPTQPINLSDKESSFTMNVYPIIDDPDIELLNTAKSFFLTAVVGEKKKQKYVENVKIFVSRLVPNLDCTLNPNNVNVVVEGTEEELKYINEEELIAQIDVGGLSPSVEPYKIRPVVELKKKRNDISIVSFSPEYVEVKIKEK